MSLLRDKRAAIKEKCAANENDYEVFLNRLRAPSREQYIRHESNWRKFVEEMAEPDLVPDLDTLRLFVWWCALRSKGRLAETPDVKTLSYELGNFKSFYNKRHPHTYQIPDEDVTAARKYVRIELAEELNLQNLRYAKEYCNWKDMKIIIRYVIAEDPHIYRNERLRIQLVSIFLFMAENGERPGAIMRSTSYRKTADALRYQDVELFLRPADGGPKWKLQITFHNRKNERGTNDPFIDIYYSRSGPAHCTVMWFLVLAFMDDAFNIKRSPADLFSMENPGESEIPIRFKSDMGPTPIFRTLERGSNIVSPEVPWGAGSVLNQAQRVVDGTGFPQRWTFYCVRRTMGNTLDDSNVSITQRKRLMGHHGQSDRIFEKAYQSRKNTLDSGNIFRKEKPRAEKLEELSMHLRRDANALKIPDDLLNEAVEKDNQIIEMRLVREAFRSELVFFKKDPSHACNAQTVKGCITFMTKSLEKRTQNLKSKAKKDFKKRYFQDPVAMRAQYPSAQPAKKVWRGDLVDALYPDNPPEMSALPAIETLLKYCREQVSSQNKFSASERTIVLSHGLDEVDLDSQVFDFPGRTTPTPSSESRKRKEAFTSTKATEHRVKRSKPSHF